MEVTRGMSLCGDYYATEGNLMRLTLGNFDYRNNCFKDDKSKDNLYFSGDVKTEFILNEGDIITPLTEQAIGLLGSTAKVPCSGKYIQSQDVGLIKCNDKLNPDFAYYLIPSKLVRTQLSAAAQQTKIRHTSPDKIKNCTVWIPDYSTQEKIGKLLSALDDKIALNRRMNAKLEQMAKRLFDHWFVQFDFPNADGKPYKSSGGKMEYNEVLKREIPQGWEVSNVCKVADILSGGTPSKANYNFWNGNIPFFGPTDYTGDMFQLYTAEKITQEGLDHCASSLFDENTIIITARGSVGKLVIVGNPMAMNQSCYALKSKNRNQYEYLYFLTIQLIESLKVKSSGSVFKSIITSDIENSFLIIADSAIIDSFCEKVKPLFLQIKENSKETQKLTVLRDRLLPLLMNGQVEVK